MEQVVGYMKQVASTKIARSGVKRSDFYIKSSLMPPQNKMVGLVRFLDWFCSVKFLFDSNLFYIWGLGVGNWNLAREGGVFKCRLK